MLLRADALIRTLSLWRWAGRCLATETKLPRPKAFSSAAAKLTCQDRRLPGALVGLTGIDLDSIHSAYMDAKGKDLARYTVAAHAQVERLPAAIGDLDLVEVGHTTCYAARGGGYLQGAGPLGCGAVSQHPGQRKAVRLEMDLEIQGVSALGTDPVTKIACLLCPCHYMLPEVSRSLRAEGNGVIGWHHAQNLVQDTLTLLVQQVSDSCQGLSRGHRMLRVYVPSGAEQGMQPNIIQQSESTSARIALPMLPNRPALAHVQHHRPWHSCGLQTGRRTLWFLGVGAQCGSWSVPFCLLYTRAVEVCCAQVLSELLPGDAHGATLVCPDCAEQQQQPAGAQIFT